MKNRAYTNASGTVSVVIFAPEAKLPSETEQQFMDRVYAELRSRDPSIPASFVDIEPADLPPRTDVDGVTTRPQWRISGSSVVKDTNVRNPHRELFDKDAEIAAVKSKGNGLNINDLLDIQKKQVEREQLVKDTKGN